MRSLRVISLAPTQTEIIAALGQVECLTGVTVNCDYPAGVHRLPSFGSWWAPELPRVMDARPDLVCTFGLHQDEVAATLREAGLTVYHSDPDTVAHSLETIRELASVLGCPEKGEVLWRQLTERLETVRSRLNGLEVQAPLPSKPEDLQLPLPQREGRGEGTDDSALPRVLRIMNWEPFITVGPGAFQHDVIVLAGGVNIVSDGPAPYFVLDPRDVQARDPDVIFFCEPHLQALLESDPDWRRVKAVRERRVAVFPCGLTCRSGPRIVDMVEGLARLLHPTCWIDKPSSAESQP